MPRCLLKQVVIYYLFIYVVITENFETKQKKNWELNKPGLVGLMRLHASVHDFPGPDSCLRDWMFTENIIACSIPVSFFDTHVRPMPVYVGVLSFCTLAFSPLTL